MENQSLNSRYIDKQYLDGLLRKLFGNDYIVEDLGERFLLSVPRRDTITAKGIELASHGNDHPCNDLALDLYTFPNGSISNYHNTGCGDTASPVSTLNPMDSLRAEISALRLKNTSHQYFVPHGALDQYMTKDAIRDALTDSNAAIYHLDELAESILQGSPKIFAILILIRQVQYTSHFIRNDQFQDIRSHLDHKLPFRYDTLENLLPQLAAKEFHEKQWEFAAPVFTKKVLPRSLVPEIALPILKDTILGIGGFGEVHEIEIHPFHQRFGVVSGQKYVRKEFRPSACNDADYELELRNLSILNHLRHPNILELLSAYTYDGRHNLIFPCARGGDLATFLRNERPSRFEADESLVVALAKLASAIEQVHFFAAQTIKLSLIGCHHDLKPSNILVDNSTSILADFGLSRLKGTSKSSNTQFKMGQGDYLAPESEDIDGSFEKHSIGRSSDIWSFGCIIAEVLTYMIDGVDGVKEFKEARRYRIGNFRYSHFHHGPKQPSTGVSTWLSRIGDSTTGMGQQLLSLVRMMLAMDPDQRPKATEVAARLRSIALEKLAELICEQFAVILEQSCSIEALIEQTRFESWKRVYEFGIVEPGTGSLTHEFNYDFEATLDGLYLFREELNAIASTDQAPQDSIFLPLRHLNNRLRNLLPLSSQKEIQRYLECEIIKTQDMELLNKAQRAFEDRSSNGKIAMLARIKLMTVLATERSHLHANLRVNSNHLERLKTLADCDLGLMNDIERGYKRQVLVEWMRYGSPLAEEMKGHERLVRVEAVAELLNSADKPEDFRVLHCAGFFHETNNNRFGLVFNFPDASTFGRGESEAITLWQIIDFENRNQHMPALEDRFVLAHALAVSVAEFHKVKWLHKAISSSHVVFFPPLGSRVVDYVRQPYIIGFNHSRPDEPSAFTDGPGEDSYSWNYHHPDYLRNRSRYRPIFDYYSLGVVLLEIGLWTSLEKMTGSRREAEKAHQPNFEHFRDLLLKKKVPLLKPAMGTRYYSLVDSCLKADFGASQRFEDNTEGDAALHLDFERLVVERLASYSI